MKRALIGIIILLLLIWGCQKAVEAPEEETKEEETMPEVEVKEPEPAPEPEPEIEEEEPSVELTGVPEGTLENGKEYSFTWEIKDAENVEETNIQLGFNMAFSDPIESKIQSGKSGIYNGIITLDSQKAQKAYLRVYVKVEDEEFYSDVKEVMLKGAEETKTEDEAEGEKFILTGKKTFYIEREPSTLQYPIPPEPYAYSGAGYESTEGSVEIDLNDKDNSGIIELKSYIPGEGKYSIKITSFKGKEDYQSGGVAKYLTLHGATGRGEKTLPETFAYLAAWGEAEVKLEGKEFLDPVTGDSTLKAYVMVSQGVRSEKGLVRNKDKSGIFNPAHPENGYVDTEDLEITVWIMSHGDSPKQFFQHYIFEEVTGLTERQLAKAKVQNNQEGEMKAIKPNGVKQTVVINDFKFQPAEIEIMVGTEVVWTNNDIILHTASASNFDSKLLGPGKSFSHVFTEPGEYTYYCTLHPGSEGKITVK